MAREVVIDKVKWTVIDEDKPHDVGRVFRPSAVSDLTDWRLMTDSLSTEEFTSIVAQLEREFNHPDDREGYEIVANATCAKGPQQMWWSLIIEFESKDWRDRFLQALSPVL